MPGPGVTELIAPDLVLLLLEAPSKVRSLQGRVNGITRLEKLLYLAEREQAISDSVEGAFEFKAYHYGPYSKQVYDAVELLKRLGFIDEERFIEDAALDEMEE